MASQVEIRKKARAAAAKRLEELRSREKQIEKTLESFFHAEDARKAAEDTLNSARDNEDQAISDLAGLGLAPAEIANLIARTPSDVRSSLRRSKESPIASEETS